MQQNYELETKTVMYENIGKGTTILYLLTSHADHYDYPSSCTIYVYRI